MTLTHHRSRLPCAVLASALLLVLPAVAHAGTDFGIRGGIYGDNADPLLGVELLTNLGPRGWFFNPNVEASFGDVVDTVSFNADVHYDLITTDPYQIWAGAGAAVIHRSFDRPFRRGSDNQTDVGLNLLVGAAFHRHAAVRPYVQAKAAISDDTEGSLVVGVRF